MPVMRVILVISCLFLWVLPAKADHLWVPPKGTLRTAFSLTGAQWDQFLKSGGTSVALPGEITQYELALYAEYTPVEHFSMDILLPFVISQRSFVFVQTDVDGNILGVEAWNGEVRDVDTNSGLGDVFLGANYILFNEGFSLGLRGFTKFPGSYAVGEIANSPGDGQSDFGLVLLTGARIPSIRSYIRGSFSYVLRLGEPANQFEIMIEPGINITNEFSARFLYQHVEQLGGDSIQFYNLPNFYPAVEEDADRIGIGLSYKASDLLGFFVLYQQTVYGKNTANTKAITLGVDFTF